MAFARKLVARSSGARGGAKISCAGAPVAVIDEAAVKGT
jgi:hypothetical protein